MARKIFLSFLGTNNYIACKYVSSTLGESKVVQFVQEAICQLACSDFTLNDVVYIFLTKDAEEKNWRRLNEIFQSSDLTIEPVKDIPEGYEERDIWKIFEKVFEQIQNNDEVILDITHGFRSLPMLTMVLLSYAKSLKNISVKAIYYGAFEALGPAFNMETLIPNPEDRKAPLLDLKSFSTLQDWTFGAESFKQTGNPKSIVCLTNENIKPALILYGGKNDIVNSIRKLVTSIERGEKEIVTNRGKLISESVNFKRAQNELNKLTSTNEVFSPLKPLLKTISNKIKDFGVVGKNNWEASVEWCIKHGLEQQGITQLQEGIIGFVCKRNDLDPMNLKNRELTSQALNIFSKDKPETLWKSPACDSREIVIKITHDPFVVSHKKNYDRLTELRNDINHGGYRDNSCDSNDFKISLKDIYSQYKLLSSL